MSFIFQAVPKRYDLRTRMKPGLRVSWLASRYRKQMKKGDIVYFWLGGDPSERGLYGWGIISADAPKLYEGRGYRIEIEYRCNFLDRKPPKHVSSEDIRKDPFLNNHLIFRMPVGTNFLLSDEEDQALRAIIARELGEGWSPSQPAVGGGGRKWKGKK